MTPNGRTYDENKLTDWLVAYDEALAVGASETPDLPTHSAELLAARECLELLNARWPRAGSAHGEPLPDTLSEPPSSRIGRFEILGTLGRGGHGVVFRAFDPLLEREVALKVPRPELLFDDEFRRRFLREAQATAGLQHPNIVTVFEAGEAGSVCYIVAAFCAGCNLAEWLRGRAAPVPLSTAAQLIAVLARALHYTHGRGVVHRDLKPSNILLERQEIDDPQLNATSEHAIVWGNCRLVPRVTDFGLARLQEVGGDLTRTGVVLGTPCYMAPEQAECRHGDVGPTTDTYALGCLLYELLTGQPPFRGASDADSLRLLRETDAVAPRRLRKDVPRDIDTVCLKCLERGPKSRYLSAAALADDLERWLRGEPVRARRIGLFGHAWRWCRRKPVLAGVLGLLFLSVTAGLCTSLLLLHRARAGEALAVENEQREEIARRNAQVNAQEARQILADLIEVSPKGSSDLISPRRLPDTEPLVRAEAHCARLLRESPGDTELRVDLTKVRVALGAVYCERRNIESAELCFRQARELWEELAAKDARSEECRSRLAATILWQSTVAGEAKDYGRVFELKKSALAIWQQLALENPQDAGHLANEETCRRQVVEIVRGFSTVRRHLLPPLEKEVAALDELVRAQPGDRTMRHRLALAYVLLAEVLHGQGDDNRASVCWKQVHQQYRELTKTGRDDLPARLALARCCARLMQAQASDPFYVEAIALFEANLPRVAALLHQQPGKDLRPVFLREDYCSLIACHAKAGATALAEEACRKTFGNLANLVAGRSRDPKVSVDELAELSESLRAAGQITPARSIAREAVSALAPYEALASHDPSVSRWLAVKSLGLAPLLRRVGDPAESLRQAEIALHRFQDLARTTPSLLGHQDVSDAWSAIAKARWDLGQVEEAVAALWESVAAERRAYELSPNDLESRQRLDRSLGRLIDCGGHQAPAAGIVKALLEREQLWCDNAEHLMKVSEEFRQLAEAVGKGKEQLGPQELAERETYLDHSTRIKRAAEAVQPAGGAR